MAKYAVYQGMKHLGDVEAVSDKEARVSAKVQYPDATQVVKVTVIPPFTPSDPEAA